MLDIEEVNAIFSAQRANRRTVRDTTVEQRIERLSALKGEIVRRAGDIGEAIHADLGRPRDNRDEVNTVIGNIEKATAELTEWAAPLEVPVSPGLPPARRAFVQFEPRGVVLLFAVWNFPIGMCFSPLVQAIAAGNVVMVKANPLAPSTGQVIAEIVQAVFPADEVAVFVDEEVAEPQGPRQMNDVLSELPIDHVFLTGSPRVGKIVAAAAAKNLTTVTLELGGKSPAIIDRSGDLDLVSRELVGAKLYNHGQTCLSVDFLWVPAELRDDLAGKYAEAVRHAFYEADRFCYERDSRFVDKRNYERVRGLLEDAVQRGAKIAFGGRCNEDALVIEPTVLVDVPLDADILREEIFGPVLPVLGYIDEREVWDHLDTLSKPLGMFVYAQDDAFIDRALQRTTSGGITINGHAVHWAEQNLPFGGVNTSGSGRYHGVWGYREFSNMRAVYQVDHQPASVSC